MRIDCEGMSMLLNAIRKFHLVLESLAVASRPIVCWTRENTLKSKVDQGLN